MEREKTTYKEIYHMLKSHNLDMNMNSILNILKNMPLIRKKIGRESVIFVDKSKLKSYLPYSNKNVKDLKDYDIVVNLYKNGKSISFISKEMNIPWSTIRDWVYGNSKPRIMKGNWYKELFKKS